MKRHYHRLPQPPITPETTARNAKRWLNIVRYGESGTIIQLQDDCEYRVGEIINNPTLLKATLGPYYKKYLLAYVPIDHNNITDTIHKTLLALAIDKKLGTKGTLTGLTNSELLGEIGQKGYEVGLFISHISSLLMPNTMQPLIDLESLIRMSKNFSVIMFSEIDITHPAFSIFADKCSFMFDHVIKYPLYGEADSRQFMLYYGSEWHFSVPEKITDEIIWLSGGYLWLVHQIFRFLRDNPSDTVSSATTTDALKTKLATIWEKLDGKQKELLRRTHFGTLTQIDVASHEFEYLSKIHLIQQRNQSPHLGIPLLAQVIENELKLSKWHVKENNIMIGSKDLTALFTKKEKLVLTFLIKNKKTLITRDDVAHTIWGNTSEEKYSDWAIDRLIFRIRTKLKKADANSKLIKTVKKKGFIFG